MKTNEDFVRSMPDSAHHFGKARGIWQRIHIDPILLLMLLTLCAVGLYVLYSAGGESQRLIKRQGLVMVVGFTAMFTIAQCSLHVIKRWAPWFYLGGVVLLILVMFFGVGAKGAQRWLSLGFMRFQPSEILKVGVPITVAAFFASRALPPKFKDIILALTIVAVPFVLILRQPDLGTSILVAASGLFVLFLAGISWRYILGALGLLLVSLWPIWQYVLQDYQKTRILTLFNPEADKWGAGWNTIQAKIAIGSGGLDGKGWREGTQSQLDFLPESHTDFIIAVLAEELGFIGVVLLCVLYIGIILRGMLIAARSQNTFGRLMAGSITLTFFVYLFVNMGMVSGMLPVVGVPLPLVSYGGTSMVTLMMGFGLLMAVATEKKKTM